MTMTWRLLFLKRLGYRIKTAFLHWYIAQIMLISYTQSTKMYIPILDSANPQYFKYY